ncbi:lipoyl synthase [Candidatus Margulisiibacteriota bacterium]
MPKLPDWFKKNIKKGDAGLKLAKKLTGQIPNCICLEARCPNRAECFNKKQLTFLVLGKTCTRNCSFCSVNKGKPSPPDKKEAETILETIAKLGLKFVVITSPTRDDLVDGGAGHFAFIIKEIRKHHPKIKIEVLIPDFQGNQDALNKVVQANPDVINHNLETVPQLYETIRPQAVFNRSLKLLSTIKSLNPGILSKTGLMVGFGETEQDLVHTFHQIAATQVNILTIGQYLKPSRVNIEVKKYYNPTEFNKLESLAKEQGIEFVFAGPLIRSSFLAEDIFRKYRS